VTPWRAFCHVDISELIYLLPWDYLAGSPCIASVRVHLLVRRYFVVLGNYIGMTVEASTLTHRLNLLIYYSTAFTSHFFTATV